MDNDKLTQQTDVEANPNNGAENNIPQNNEGKETNTPQVENKIEGKTFTQKDLDDAYAKARGTAERDTTKKLLAKLGLRPDEEDKLEAFKQAYEDSKTDEQKRNEEFEDLQARNVELEYDLEEKDYTIKALIELTGKKEEDVDDIVKMSKGLKTEDNTIEDCIKKVISMLKPQTEQTAGIQHNIPTGQPIEQPSKVVTDPDEAKNPWKHGPTFNLTRQGEIVRTNPELAKRLASEAGVQLKY